MLKFFHSPDACSDGILVLLEEIGAAYEVEVIDLVKGKQRELNFLEKTRKIYAVVQIGSRFLRSACGITRRTVSACALDAKPPKASGTSSAAAMSAWGRRMNVI